jgi:hypothetical protein
MRLSVLPFAVSVVLVFTRRRLCEFFSRYQVRATRPDFHFTYGRPLAFQCSTVVDLHWFFVPEKAQQQLYHPSIPPSLHQQPPIVTLRRSL